MKQLILIICLSIICISSNAQSKWSFGIQVNQSENTSDVLDVCILQSNGGTCFNLLGKWQTNVYALVNVKLNKRFRLQSGLGLNRLHFDEVNEHLGEDRFKYSFVSLPIRAHYLLGLNRFRSYIGVGLRIDKRTNSLIPIRDQDGVYDNSIGIGLSAEGVFGFEYLISEVISINLEPTYSIGISKYTQPIGMPITWNPNLPLLTENPQRIGVSIGLMINL